MASGDVSTVPLLAIVHNKFNLREYVMELYVSTGRDTDDQLVPLEDLQTVPVMDMATNNPNSSADITFTIDELLLLVSVQLVPLELVKVDKSVDIAQNSPNDLLHAILIKSVAKGPTVVHEVPFDEYRTLSKLVAANNPN
jgi:hypothetical protein